MKRTNICLWCSANVEELCVNCTKDNWRGNFTGSLLYDARVLLKVLYQDYFVSKKKQFKAFMG